MKTIKKISIALLSAVTLFFVPGCFIDGNGDGPFGCIDADGSIVSQELDLSNFDGIELRMEGKVFIRQGNRQEVIVEAPRDLIEELELDVDNGIWEIETDDCVRYNDNDFRVYITLPDITFLRVAGSGDIVSENVLIVDDLELNVSGSGNIDIATEADDIIAKISGSGDMFLEGIADLLDFITSGSGDYSAFNLDARAAKIQISGSGNAEVRVSDRLDVRISGSGDVRYKGNPIVNTQISGSGRVVNAN